MQTTEINWGYNCLTQGIHHGRPEAIWNLPLMQAIVIFPSEDLTALVIERIYKDAMQFVEHSSFTQEWADRVKECALMKYRTTLQHKVGELKNYYDSARYKLDVKDVVQWYKDDKLNPHYQPLHSHDSLNLLCRIIGVECSIEASK